MRRVKAVIMAGGEGSRLRPLTCDRPKPLVPVCNRPVMAYTLDLLAEHGFQEVILTLGYMPEAIMNLFGPTFRKMRLRYVVEETPLGTAGGVAALRHLLDATFLVISGDALTDMDLTRLIQVHRERGAVATLALSPVENPLEYGVVLTDAQGRIRRFLEKPGWGEVFSDTVNTGVYVLEPDILRGVPDGRMYDFSQHLFPALLQVGAPLYGAVMDGYWEDIGDPAAYLRANLDLLSGRLRFSPPGWQVAPGVWVSGDGTPPGLLVDGPALIGAGCWIAPGARLEAGAVLGPGTAVGEGAVVRRSVTWAGVKVGMEATVVGAVLCTDSALGPGTGVYEGAVVGPQCQIGARAVVSPGVRLWPKTVVSPGARADCTLVQSPVWSGRWLRQGSMFGTLGSDLFPENALRVGTAFASILPGNGPLVVGGDPGPAASLLKQALVCGARAAGRGVLDTGVSASPVTEFAILHKHGAGGIHVRADGEQARVVFYDATGQPVSRQLERKLEQTCVRQDFPRATPAGAGVVEAFTQAEWLYLEHLARLVDLKAIRQAGISVQAETKGWDVLHRWLDFLHARPRDSVRSVCIQVDPLAATWTLPSLRPEAMLALQVGLQARRSPLPGQAVPIPVTAPWAVEQYLERLGRRCVRVRQADWRPGDPLLGIALLLEWMAQEDLTEDDLACHLPQANTSSRTVDCPWEAKGRIMRLLLEECESPALELVDGLRIRHEEGWALVVPDPDEPLYHVYAEAAELPLAEDLAERYAQRLRGLLQPGTPGE